MQDLEEEPGSADALFTALANPTRRELLGLLLEEGELPAGAMAGHFDMARPSVSEHLGVLRRAGLVSETKRGRMRVYRLEPEPFAELRAWLRPYEAFWRGRLKNLRELLEEEDLDESF